MSCRNTPISPSIYRRTTPRCVTRLCALWNNGAPEGPRPLLEEERAVSRAQHLALLVVLDPQVRNLFLTPQVAQGVLQFGELNEEVVLGVEEGSAHRALEVEGQPLLNAAEATALRQVEEEHQVEDEWRRQDTIAAQELHLDLHGIIEPAKNVDVIPAFLVIPTRFVVMDVHLVLVLAVEILVQLRLQNVFEHRQFAALLGAEGVRIVQHVAVPIAQDIRGKPAVQAQLPGFQSRSNNGFHERLAGLKILAADRYAAVGRQFQ